MSCGNRFSAAVRPVPRHLGTTSGRDARRCVRHRDCRPIETADTATLPEPPWIDLRVEVMPHEAGHNEEEPRSIRPKQRSTLQLADLFDGDGARTSAATGCTRRLSA